MRWFWAFVAVLLLMGAWFVLGSNHAASTAPRVSAAPEGAVVADAEAITQTESKTNTQTATATDTAPAVAPEIDLLGESGTVVAPGSTVLTDTRSPNDVVRRIDDRTIELDGRFRIIGNGGPDDPYRVSWELLTSAAPYIDASKGSLTPPPWVRLLDGTWIEISGYYSTAVRVTMARNLLLTLNRWDGCCIGLPPTPFDALDMTMRQPVSMQGLHLFRFGTFRGRLTVSPFETGGFLLGLYKLDEATFETK